MSMKNRHEKPAVRLPKPGFGPPRREVFREARLRPFPDSVPPVCLPLALALLRAREGVKKSSALTTETPRHREEAPSFQFSVPRCLCGEKFV
jgi:hypothetical protein